MSRPEAAVVSPAPEASAARPGFRKRAIGGAVWTFLGYACQQGLRFANNLILARLLFPEAFGLMALTQVFATGLEMLSDVGVGPAIIQGKRGEDPLFLRTAFTVQVIRGLILGLLAAGMAWPVARLYGEPQLAALLPAVGFGLVLRGLTSIRMHTLRRKVLLARLTVLELVAQATAVVVTVLAAWLLRSVWALVVGSTVSVLTRVLLSHLMLPGPADGFTWDRQAVRDLTRVGRWVFISTATTFLVGHLDRLTLGRLLDPAALGIYTMALFLATALPMVGRTVSSQVFFPLLSETAREAPHLLYRRLRKARLVWAVPTCAALIVLALVAEPLVEFLYPAKFSDAGWMLGLLAAGSIPAVINQSMGVVWPALGEFRMLTLLMLVQIPTLLGAMVVGHTVAGMFGVVAGIALVELFIYPVQSLLAHRRRLWQPEVDMPLLAACAAALCLGFLRM